MRRGIELAPARDPRFTRASARASTAVTRAVHRRAPLRAPENAALRRIGVDLHRSALFRLKDASRPRNRRTLSPAWPRRSLQTAARGVGAGATRHAVDPTRSQPRPAARELRPLREAIAVSRLSCDQMSYKGFGDGGEYRTSHGGKIFWVVATPRARYMPRYSSL